MANRDLDRLLDRLALCVEEKRWESLETHGLEIKPVPPNRSKWSSILESVCAFLNTRGGTIILGVRDQQVPQRHYAFTGYDESQSTNLAHVREAFSDLKGHPLDVSEKLRLDVRRFLEGHVAIIQVEELSDDQKFCFLDKVAYRRVLDRDEAISSRHLEEQEMRKQEMERSRELGLVEGLSLEEFSLQRINELIFLINQGQAKPIETIKSSLEDAQSFLYRKRFLRDRVATILGALVVAAAPEDHLGFRSHLDAFVDVPSEIAQDKKTWRDNILQLMEAGSGWTLRNIFTGVSAENAGSSLPEYPEKLIRECINNALAHRDYSIDRPVQLTLKPRVSFSIRNPGRLPADLLVEALSDAVPLRRIFASPHARNPKLADILKLHTKWEGKGIGMSDLVNYALSNEIDLPYYIFNSNTELTLTIPSGKILDEEMEARFDLLDKFILERTGERELTDEHRLVLAYLLKCERSDHLGRYTLALTPSNNHFGAISELRQWGLIHSHEAGDVQRPVYLVAREMLLDQGFLEIRNLFGSEWHGLDTLAKETLLLISLAEKYSRSGGLNAKQVSRLMKYRMPQEWRRRGEDELYRAIRLRIEKLAPIKRELDLSAPTWHSNPLKMLSVRGPAARPTYRLNHAYQPAML